MESNIKFYDKENTVRVLFKNADGWENYHIYETN